VPNCIADAIYTELEEVEKWLLNYARNANNLIPIVSATTAKKVNAPRRLQFKRLPDRITSYTQTRKIEVRYDCAKWSSRSSGRKPHRLNIDSNESSLMWLAGAIQ
jgi:hypothetical protein